MAIEFRHLSQVRGRSPAFRWVRQFLLGRYFELSLKAYLLSRGYTAVKIKSLGHDLDSCLRAAMKEGLRAPPISAKVRRQLTEFNRRYRDKAFEYFSPLELLAPGGTHEYGSLWRYAERCHRAVLDGLRTI